MRNIDLRGRTVVVANVGGQFFAIDGRCTSDGANLANGDLRGFIVRCPGQGEEFDLRTGKVVNEPWGNSHKANDLRIYPVFLQDGCIYADIT